MKYPTFYKCTAGRVIYIEHNAADIENVNVISNSPTSGNTDLFYFYSGTSLSNVYIADNKHTAIGEAIESGAAFYANNFAVSVESYTPFMSMEHLSSFKCELGTIFIPTLPFTKHAALKGDAIPKFCFALFSRLGDV
jgi:hypothetical protein